MKFGEYDLTFTQILMIAGGFCAFMLVIAIDKKRWLYMLFLVVLVFGLHRKIQERRGIE